MSVESQDPLPDLIKKFQQIKTHAERCEFLHDPKNYPHLGKIYGGVHYPKPEQKPETT